MRIQQAMIAIATGTNADHGLPCGRPQRVAPTALERHALQLQKHASHPQVLRCLPFEHS
jgi:hypothetical protein